MHRVPRLFRRGPAVHTLGTKGLPDRGSLAGCGESPPVLQKVTAEAKTEMKKARSSLDLLLTSV